MIEINLLPGAGRKKASGKSSASLAQVLAKVSSRFSGPNVFLVISGAIVIAALAGVGFMYWKQMTWRAETDARLEKAIADSTRFADAVAAQEAAKAKADTILWQANLIRSIDDDRYIWPHLMDEISKALPQYTWITSIEPIGVQGQANVVSLPPKAAPAPVVIAPADTAGGKFPPRVVVKGKPVPVVIPKDVIEARITGMTADIEALTIFMRDLADSPFIGQVSILNSSVKQEDGKDAYLFTLKVKYQRPDSTVIRRTPIAVTVR